MKNLHLFSVDSTATTSDGDSLAEELSSVIGFCVDAAAASSYFATSSAIICVNEQMEQQYSVPWDIADLGKLVLFDFLIDDMEICAVFSEGAILLISMPSGDIQEQPTLFDKKVLGGAWSPDLGLLVIATDSQLLAITRNFEIREECEVELFLQDPGKEQLMTIGWGARETQFQGRAGRQKREKIDENTIPGPLCPRDDRKVIVSWRGDAQYFTVSTVEHRPNPLHAEDSSQPETVECRHLRVWNRDMELMSQCEPLAGAEPALAMRPNGNLLAVPRVLHGKRDLWLYERNGQWRSHFYVGLADSDVVSVGWNTDSSILLIHLRQGDQHLLQLWTVSNYDWTLKIEILRKAIRFASWDPEDPRKLHFVDCNGRYDVAQVESDYDSQDSIVSVVATGCIRVTDLNKAPIPPPMFQYSLATGERGAQLISQNGNHLAVLLSDSTLLTYELKERKFELIASVKLPVSNANIAFNLQVCDGSVSFISGAQIISYHSNFENANVVCAAPESLVYHQFLPEDATWFAQTVSGVWGRIVEGEFAPIGIKFNSSYTHRCRVLKLPTGVCFFGINRNNQLLVNGHIAHQSIGSWSFGQEEFLVTTLNNELYAMTFERLVELLKNPPKMTAKNAAYGWFCEGTGRSVERGAAVVAHESNGVRVFLQMPRGNLETVEPRFLIVPKLKKMIANADYGKAIALMRRQRVDMNLLYDHDPAKFLEKIRHFVDDIDNVHLLDLFMFDLAGEDSTRQAFLPFYPERAKEDSNGQDKISVICRHMLEAILAIPDMERRLRLYTVALSCFLKQTPPRIREAYLSMREQIEAAGLPFQQTNEQFVQQKPSVFRRWIKHLKYYVKDSVLFRYALQTYDLALAYEVADEISMDPREFMPLFDSLKDKSPEEYKRFYIDNFVEDYSSALHHIAQVDERIEECLEHVKRHKLYSEALRLFNGKPNYARVCKAYAEHIMSLKQYDEAGILFQQAGDYVTAVKCYEHSLNLVDFQIAAKKASLEPQAVHKSVTLFALKFEQQGQFTQAAQAYELLGVENNLMKIVVNYAKGLDWPKAMFELDTNIDHPKYAEVRSSFIQELESRCSFILSSLDQINVDVDRHSRRLEVVRENKGREVTDWVENEGEADLAQSETMSEASSASGMSNISRLSKMSVAQAKRRKNVEKKKKSVKEGSHYEDIGLLSTLTELMHRLNRIQDELKTFLRVLLAFNLLSDARSIQVKAEEVVRIASNRRVSIWPRYITAKNLTGPLVEIYREEDGIVRMPGENHMPPRIYLEDEMLPPKLDTSFSWKLKSLE